MTNPIGLFRRSRVCVLAGLLVALLAGANPPAHAAPASPPTFVVNRTFDAPASPPLDNGVCETAPGDGICTLRAAVMKANHYPGGGVSITLPPLTGGAVYRLTRPPANGDDETGGDLNLMSALSINGGGAANTIIDASAITPTTRVMEIQSPNVSIVNVMIRGGQAAGLEFGGGLLVRSGGNLFLFASKVMSNTAFNGGGIYNDGGSLTLIADQVSNNRAGADGGGIYNTGGTFDLDISTVSGNTSLYGGGVWNSGQNQFIIGASTLYGNSAYDGGGLYNEAVTDVTNSTLSNNFADGSGGGIFNNTLGPCGFCQVFLYQATLVGNLANQAVSGGAGGGLYNLITSTLYLQNTLLDGNVRSTAGPDVFDDCAGLVISAGYNLVSTTSGCSIAGGTHDLKDVPGRTGPLQNNGGSTFTNGLLPGSPAIDAIPMGTSGCGSVEHVDQRFFPRPAFGAHSFACDIGAFELQAMTFLPLVRK